MTLREKVRKAIRRVSPGFPPPKDDGKPKIEYYRRNEVPRSKYRGPVDPEHQRRLRAWTFEGAMVERRRSLDLELSPCASIDESVAPCDDEEPSETPSPDVDDGVVADLPDDSPTVFHQENASDRRTKAGSQASTAVNSDSWTSSIVTLPVDHQASVAPRRCSIAQIKTLPQRAPTTQTRSSLDKHVPFSPDYLAQALSATQIRA
ncbi:hypothetical protein ANI_1_1214074 [Paecilomyces variotii No. 5]|uniref:Uncharacterized protein n=1 Tax=Byssochlamys spectabilis (strain No. 5 / NBRC 109023) TaxID=1356009 RepID=V5G111_BYSSN|nr:hypothetical protein ANI_1_1214074 [Paecilomyces variotii No. 5]